MWPGTVWVLRWQCLQRTTSHSGLAVCDGCWSYLVGSSGRMELTDALQNLWTKELFHHSPTQPPNRATVRGALDRQSYTPLDSLASSPQLSAVIIALPAVVCVWIVGKFGVNRICVILQSPNLIIFALAAWPALSTLVSFKFIMFVR